MNKTATTPICVRIPKTTKAAFVKGARKKKVKASELVRRALEAYLHKL